MMSDVDHSLLMALRDFIRPVVHEVVREVVTEELANYKPPTLRTSRVSFNQDRLPPLRRTRRHPPQLAQARPAHQVQDTLQRPPQSIRH